MKHTERRPSSLTREQLVELADDPELLFADDFDEAMIGVATRCGQKTIVVYDLAKCIDVLTAQGLAYEDAVEHLDYNTLGAWVGDRTPIFVVRPDDPGQEER